MENTKEKGVIRFKYEAERYLNTFGIEALRTYGRSLQLEAPKKLRKGALIAEILKVLCKEIFPQRNKKGAPIKSRCVDEQIIKTISELKAGIFLMKKSRLCKDCPLKKLQRQTSRLIPFYISQSLHPCLINSKNPY